MKYDYKSIRQIIEKNKFLIVLITLILISTSHNFIQKQKIENLKSEIKYCENEKSDLEDEIDEANRTIEELEDKLDNCQTNLQISESDNWDLQLELANERMNNF